MEESKDLILLKTMYFFNYIIQKDPVYQLISRIFLLVYFLIYFSVFRIYLLDKLIEERIDYLHFSLLVYYFNRTLRFAPQFSTGAKSELNHWLFPSFHNLFFYKTKNVEI